MDVDRIVSDGTLKGTQVLNELNLPCTQMVRRVTIDVNAEDPVLGGVVRIEYYMTNPDDLPVYDDGDMRIVTVYRKIKHMEVKVDNA